MEGQFLKEAIVRLTNYSDLPKALSYCNRVMKKQCIEVTEANEKDFTDAKCSLKVPKFMDSGGTISSYPR